jgi:tetratricopeptide (TPR) repeat protein
LGWRRKNRYIVSFLLLFIFLGSVRLYGREQPEAEKKTWASASQKDEDFRRLWAERKEAISRNDTIVGEQYLKEIITLKLDKGIINLWEYALLLIREGIAVKDKEYAIKLGEFALKMAPDLPYVYFVKSQIIWGKDKLDVYPALTRYFEGVEAYTRNVPLALSYFINSVYPLGLGALLAILVFCLIVFAKHLPIHIYAIKEELKGEKVDVIRGVVNIFLLFLPLLLQLNIIWCSLFWCIMFWKYLARGAKGVVVLCLFLVTYLPPFGKVLFNFIETPEVQTIFDIYETNYGERQHEALERLQLWSEKHPKDRDALFALALAFKKEGDYTTARRYYQEIMKLNPSDHNVIANIGNIYFALGDLDKAIRLYQQAIEVNPYNGIYYFNLSKALSQKSMLLLQDADKNFQRAKELSPSIIGAHLEIDSPQPNRSVIDEIIPLERLRKRLFSEFWRVTGPSFYGLDVWLRNLSPRFPFIFPLIFVFLLIALSYSGKRGTGWWKCSLCGGISTQAYARKEGNKKICIRCFRILKGKKMDQELTQRKMREIKVFQRRSGFYDRLIPFILPGGGHVWKGYNLRGLFFLWIFFIFVGKFYYWKEIVPLPIPYSTYSIFGGGFLIFFAFVIFYILVLKGAYKRKGLEKFESPFSLEGI